MTMSKDVDAVLIADENKGNKPFARSGGELDFSRWLSRYAISTIPRGEYRMAMMALPVGQSCSR
jgi:hypothetical protein